MVLIKGVDIIVDENKKEETVDKTEDYEIGKASNIMNRYYNYSADDLYDQIVSGKKPTLRNLFKTRLCREDKIRLSREFTWGVGLLYRIMMLKVAFIVDGLRVYHEDDKVEQKYREINEELDIEKYAKNAAFEHEVIGEWFPFLSWDGDELSKLTILDPKQVKVKSVFGKDLIYLKPNTEITKLINDPDPEVRKRVRKILPSKYYKNWKDGREVLFDEDEIFRCTNQKAYHENYSHTPIEPIFDDLALLSMYKESDYSIAYKIKKAILQVKVGNKDLFDGEPVPEKILDMAEKLFQNPSESAEVFTQWFMDAEWIIPDGDIYSSDKYESVIDSIISWSGMTAFLGQDSGAQSGAEIKASMFYEDVKRARSEIRKSIIEIYKRIAEKKGIKTYGDNIQLPKVKFSNLNLMSNEDKLNTIEFLYKHGLLSPDTTLDTFDYDIEEEFKIRSEEGKKQKYLDYITVPFEPSQDVNMKSFLRKEMEFENQKEMQETEPSQETTVEDNEEIDETSEEGGENDG